MSFSVGDLLVKVDSRANAETICTRHHVMLVIGESAQGYPIVAHMQAVPHWTLVKEELKRGKELILIRPSWSAETQLAITKAVEDALNSKMFVITKEIIEEQNTAVSPYRTDCSHESKKKLKQLLLTYDPESPDEMPFTPKPKTQTIMSCHQWVLSIIHYACQQTNTPIPLALRIAPHLAWADRLDYSSEQDPSVTRIATSLFPRVTQLQMPRPLKIQSPVPIKPTEETSFFSSLFAFFKLSKPDTQTKKPSSSLMVNLVR